MEGAFGFSLDVINEVNRAINESGIPLQDVAERMGKSRSYLYNRLKGNLPFNTNDISMIAAALGMDAFLILHKAAQRNAERTIEERERRTLEKIARHDMTLAAYKDEDMDREAEDFGA